MDSIVKKVNSAQGIESILLALRLFIMVILLGYIMIWAMMPTNTFWLHWLPEIHSEVNSTYFGLQGANVLIYTFPVLLIAVLGCFCLHLGKTTNDKIQESSPKHSFSASWSRPALVKGPLGIVSWTELCFLLTFIALFVWSFSAYLHGMFANITRKSAAQMTEKMWEAKLNSAALVLGLLGNICLAFLFFPIARGSSILRLVGLTSESSIKYHIWLGHMVMTLFTAHGLCFIILWIDTRQITNMLRWDKVGVSNLAGEIALLSGLAMWVTSYHGIRRKIFELFFYSHHLYILFIVFFVFHVGVSYACIMLPGFYLFLIDRFLRFLQSQQRVRLVSAHVLPCKAVELNFSKLPELSYNPTSIVFINIPGISKLQWHPFTVTSNSNIAQEKLSVVIKSEGIWSQELYQKLSSPSPVECLEVSIEGPYGPASTHFLRHDMLVMVSGGSGITPFISMIHELLFRANTTSCKIRRVLLITAFRKSVDLAMLQLLSVSDTTAYDILCLQLQIEAYVTKEKEPTTDKQKLDRTIWFKPSDLDAPVSSILGSYSWLWLGAIISSSFVIFLLLMGITTRYYIYPIDHNSNMIYSYSLRSAIYMLFVCISIAIAATAAFLWNKRRNAKESRQIRSTDTTTPTTSPGLGPWLLKADRDLESLPTEPFNQATKVHYGERPNLKKMLLECEGPSIGVLVSGPREMRQEVATICSSGLANNLHFESISFSW